MRMTAIMCSGYVVRIVIVVMVKIRALLLMTDGRGNAAEAICGGYTGLGNGQGTFLQKRTISGGKRGEKKRNSDVLPCRWGNTKITSKTPLNTHHL